MPLFRLDASIRVVGSHSRAIADIVEVDMIITDPRMAAGANPVLDQFKDLAHRLRQEADRNARRLGGDLTAAGAPGRAA